jgi:hypothetical protein
LLRTDLGSEIAALRTELKAEIADLRSEMNLRIDGIHSRLDRMFITRIGGFAALATAIFLTEPVPDQPGFLIPAPVSP